MAQLMLELAAAREPDDLRVARVTLNRRGRHRAATVELARRRAGYSRQGVETGPDDQLRPRPGAIMLATGTLPAEFDQRVVLPLSEGPVVILHWLREGLQRAAQRGATLGIEQTVDADHAVLRLAQVQVSP